MNTQVEQPRRGPSLTLLHSIPMFAGVPDSQLEQIAKVAFHRRVPRLTTIVRAGDSTDSLYVLISGDANLLQSDEDGREVMLTLQAQVQAGAHPASDLSVVARTERTESRS